MNSQEIEDLSRLSPEELGSLAKELFYDSKQVSSNLDLVSKILCEKTGGALAHLSNLANIFWPKQFAELSCYSPFRANVKVNGISINFWYDFHANQQRMGVSNSQRFLQRDNELDYGNQDLLTETLRSMLTEILPDIKTQAQAIESGLNRASAQDIRAK